MTTFFSFFYCTCIVSVPKFHIGQYVVCIFSSKSATFDWTAREDTKENTKVQPNASQRIFAPLKQNLQEGMQKYWLGPVSHSASNLVHSLEASSELIFVKSAWNKSAASSLSAFSIADGFLSWWIWKIIVFRWHMRDKKKDAGFKASEQGRKGGEGVKRGHFVWACTKWKFTLQ